jgi:hypothetical protein
MSGVVTQIQDYSGSYEDQRVLQDAADILIKTYGEPQDWDPDDANPDVVGLIQYYPGGVQYKNHLSPATGRNLVIQDAASSALFSHLIHREKFNFLIGQGNESFLYDLTRTNNTYLTVTNLSAGHTLNVSVGNEPLDNATQIFRVERRVLYEYIPSNAANLTTIMLYQRTIEPEEWWEADGDICSWEGKFAGTFNCTLENYMQINFTLPNTDFTEDCFNITGNMTPWNYRNINFTASNFYVNNEDMDESGDPDCSCLNDHSIIINLNDPDPLNGDIFNSVCEEHYDNDINLTVSNNVVELDGIEIILTPTVGGCPGDSACVPTDTMTFEIWAEVPTTTYLTNYAKFILQTWK